MVLKCCVCEYKKENGNSLNWNYVLGRLGKQSSQRDYFVKIFAATIFHLSMLHSTEVNFSLRT